MRIVALLILSVCGMITSPLALAVQPDTPKGTLRITWVDTEGGAATMIITPAGETVLIDTGNPGVRDAERIAKAAKEAGIKRIDHLVTTHYHTDHFGGAAMLSTLLPIEHVHDNGQFEGMPDKPSQEYRTFPSKSRTVLNPGSTIDLQQAAQSPPIKLLCLGTRKQVIDAKLVNARDNRSIASQLRLKDRDGSDNANSTVLLLSFGDFRFFDAGDLTWNQEAELVHPYDLIGSVDVYQVTHHGLDASNNPVVMRTIRPTVAVMNNGHTKGCAPDVFADLKETSSIQAIYQVHKNLRPDGSKANAPEEFIANLESADKCHGHPIHLTVSADAAQYSVSVPSRNHQATYRTTKK